MRLTLAAFLLSPFFCAAQTPAGQLTKPSNATGQCKDGTYSTASSKSGACRGHNGVKDWYAAAALAAGAPASPAPQATPVTVASTAPSRSAATAGTPTSQTASKGPKANLANKPAAAGGAPNLVWVNTGTNVYHCYGTDFYGKTKAGSYMSEADAKAKGARPDHGNACGK